MQALPSKSSTGASCKQACDLWLCATMTTAAKHVHGPWLFECVAWATVQNSNHVGTGGTCTGMQQTKSWEEAQKFIKKHRTDPYCNVTAQRQVIVNHETCKIGESQYLTVFRRCVGCDVIDRVVPLPSQTACVTAPPTTTTTQ